MDFKKVITRIKRNSIVVMIAAIVALIITLGTFTDSMQKIISIFSSHNNESRFLEMKHEAKINCNDFFIWLENNNGVFEDSLNIIISQFDKSNSLWANGTAVPSIVEWAEGFRERRDRKIKSKLLKLEKYRDYGCDPDTLTFDYRLPVRLGKKLKIYMDIHNYTPEQFGLDTL